MTRFWKYHGLGNDFVLVDWRGRPNIDPSVSVPLLDRHFGIGGDGILAWLDGPNQQPFMRVFNADGSIADMCGNGLRCFVRWLCNEQGIAAQPQVIGTDAGDQQVIPITRDGQVTDVSVNLGPARHAGEYTVEVGGKAFTGHDLFLGNPHFVIPRAPADNEPATFGPGLSVHEHFPADTNVEWLAVISPTEANVVVYERGCGLTQACGTGGGGAVAVGVAEGLLRADVDLRVHQPGGELVYRVHSSNNNVWMTGPATRVFVGETDLL